MISLSNWCVYPNDIIGIVDFSGNLVVEYIYDAYGNIINIIDESNLNIGTINSFRYRSYYFDTETNWYYLNSRYYNPKLGRFVTMDEVEYLGASGSLLSYNLYSYCEGNPICYSDESGNDAIYAVDYKAGRGLPIVGHAILFYEYDGEWYLTDYAGNGIIKAEVRNISLGDQSAISYISKKKMTIKFYFNGNFSKIYEKANHYDGRGFGICYLLFHNNCVHYVNYLFNYYNFGNNKLKYMMPISIVPNLYVPYISKQKGVSGFRGGR